MYLKFLATRRLPVTIKAGQKGGFYIPCNYQEHAITELCNFT